MKPENPHSDSTVERPHRRFNPLIGEWVLVSPHRTKRPWLGQQEKPPQNVLPEHDPSCYLCPGGTRAGGVINPEYQGPFVFTNDFPALLPDDHPEDRITSEGFFRSATVKGTARVICFSPRHDLTLPELPLPSILDIIDIWADQTAELGQTYKWVQVFENKGEIMGCSNPHPHCQIWASDDLPTEPAKEDARQREFFIREHTPLLLEYAQQEEGSERAVLVNDHWMVVVPWWAVWPYETLLLPRHAVQRFPELDPIQRKSLADILKRLLIKYDNLFGVSFPYSMGWHGAPFLEETSCDHWILHAHFYPPLLRSAHVKKFMVGYEMLAEAQRDLTAELAAERLREVPEQYPGS